MATIEASRDAIWFYKFLSALKDISCIDRPITLYCDNTMDISNTKYSRHHMRTSILIGSIKYLGALWRVEILLFEIVSVENLVDPSIKILVAMSFERHIKSLVMRYISHLLA